MGTGSINKYVEIAERLDVERKEPHVLVLYGYGVRAGLGAGGITRTQENGGLRCTGVRLRPVECCVSRDVDDSCPGYTYS